MHESPPNQPNEQAKWDALLASEGMPSEISDVEQNSESHTAAFEHGVSELYRYYSETDRSEWGAHREKVSELKTRMQADGASPAELSLFSEDFARSVEDALVDIESRAQEYVQETLSERPSLSGRPEAIAKIALRRLQTQAPEGIEKDVLLHVALRAAHAALDA